MSCIDRHDRITGALLGVALGDALGLPFEGLSARRVRRRVPTTDRFRLVGRTGYVSDDTEQTALLAEALSIADAVDRALALAQESIEVECAADALGNTGFAVHSAGLATYCFLRHGATPMRAIEAAIRAGGDTDTHAAIVGGWVGALHGASALPRPLLDAIHDGPFGPTHLASLATALARGAPVPRWSPLAALARNLALYPVVLAHGFARLWPW